MFNKIILVGNLTRDIELRYTQGYQSGYAQNQNYASRQQGYGGGYGKQNFHNASREAYGNDKIQDIDVDADKYDSDETIPF